MPRSNLITCDAAQCDGACTVSLDAGPDALEVGWSRVVTAVKSPGGIVQRTAYLCPMHKLPDLRSE